MKIAIAGSLVLAAATLAAGPVVVAASPLPSYATGEETIKGTISSVDGKYTILVRDDRGYVDNVSLHDGTVINPTGLTLASGQTVTVLGHNAGSTFKANEIDTPYHSDYATDAGFGYVAPYAYPSYPYDYGAAYGYGYGYPYYGVYPGYGSIGLYFGFGGYGRGYYGHGGYGHSYYGRGGSYGRGYSGRGYGGRGYAGYSGAYSRGGASSSRGSFSRGGESSGRGFSGGGSRGGGGHTHR